MGNFSVHHLIYRYHQRKRVSSKQNIDAYDYQAILEEVRGEIARNHAEELAKEMGTATFRERMRSLITRYVNRNSLADKLDIVSLVDAIYNDMAGLGLIDAYLSDSDVEEINVNGWEPGAVWITTPQGKVQASMAFASAEESENIVTKAARLGGVTIDGAKPYGDSFLTRGIRMSGAISPVTDGEIGAMASIRKQKPSFVTRENIIRWGTMTAEQLELLSVAICHGISVAVAGATGSGKTAVIGLLLSEVPDGDRIVTIEDTRELNLVKRDGEGHVLNDRVHFLTKEPPNPITMQDMLIHALRYHPKILVPAEMRGKEAWTAQEAGRTGHTIVSTLHANSAREAYDRILTMCLLADTTLTEERLLRNIVSAFPLMVFKRQLPDGSRKVMEIFEATGVVAGEVSGNTIYKFVVSGKESDEQGHIVKIRGEHLRVGSLSPKLCQQLFDEGVDLEFIYRYNPAFTPLKGIS
ncbi:MAG: Flp pilus assembly complex ATPase component TadA [Symbiobacteriaceae bacterium]|nr:Flp pilus assembly complex ATPase component TadA [Symbiobacteriaceae bacterium]